MPVLDFGGVEARVVLQSSKSFARSYDLRVCTFDRARAAAEAVRAEGIEVDVLDTPKQYVYGAYPIYGVNHSHFYPVCLDGENFRVNEPMSKVGQHNVLTVYVDLSYAYICDNRRTGGFLISNWESAS